jgi:hypothetical protein
MNDIYSAYKYRRYEKKRNPKVFIIVVIILLLAAAGGIAALYFGGFPFAKLKGSTKGANTVTTPEMVFWTVEIPNFENKSTAIAQSIATKSRGGAGYLLQKGGKWTVIEGVYPTSADANREMAREDAVQTAVSDKYTIQSKEIIVPKDAADIAKNFFSQVKNTRDILITKRQELNDGTITCDDIILIANNLYTETKEAVSELDSINKSEQNANIAGIIYAANQNILALYNLVYANTEKTAFSAKLNNAIATVTFSLTFL